MEITGYNSLAQAGFSPTGEGQPAHEGRETSGQEAAESQRGEQVQAGSTAQLTESEQHEVQKMRQRDQEVRTHEQAHRSVGGRYVRGGISYDYETGPDGKRYITGGEVSIDTSAVSGDPSATIEKMRTIKRAAMAPANPSQQDRAVAAQASRAMMQAQRELTTQQSEAAGLGGSPPMEGAEGETEATEQTGFKMSTGSTAKDASPVTLPFAQTDEAQAKQTAGQYKLNGQRSSGDAAGSLLNLIA